MRQWVLLSLAITCEVLSSLSLRAGLDRPAFYVVVGLGYPASFAALGAVLRAGMPLGVAYGTWGALGVAATASFSAILFGESLSGLAVAGIAVAATGVLTVQLGGQAAARKESGA